MANDSSGIISCRLLALSGNGGYTYMRFTLLLYDIQYLVPSMYSFARTIVLKSKHRQSLLES
jgi:hypothetical protein